MVKKIHFSYFEFELKPIVTDLNSDSKARSNMFPAQSYQIESYVQVFCFNWLINHRMIAEQIENKFDW